MRSFSLGAIPPKASGRWPCRRYQYIGLCYGPPGVGKTLSARHYTRWDLVQAYQPYRSPAAALAEVRDCRAVFYTPGVINGPRLIDAEIRQRRHHLLRICQDESRE